MENELVKYVSKFMTLTQEETQAIIDHIPIQTFKKGTLLLKEGEISTKCYFNLKGLVRQYYLIDGEDKTTYFYSEEQAINSFESATQKTPSKHYLVCMEDTTLVVGDLTSGNDLRNQFPRFDAFAQQLVQEDFGKNQTLLATFMTSSPEERYLNLIKERPNLVNRVPQYQLASYLGITPESLSRIRKRILVSN